jgi:hypothetical protein
MRKITNAKEAMATGYLDSIRSRGHLDLGQLKPFCQINRLQGSALPSALIFACIESFSLRTFSHILQIKSDLMHMPNNSKLYSSP